MRFLRKPKITGTQGNKKPEKGLQPHTSRVGFSFGKLIALVKLVDK